MAVLSTRVIELGAFVVVGEEIRFSPTAGEPPSENAIAKLWSRFNERMDTVPGRVGTHAFGASLGGPEGLYVAAVEVAADAPTPEGMARHQFDPSLYAEVTYQGVLDGLMEAHDHYHGEWLPTSSYVAVERPWFERYDERFTDPRDPQCIIQFLFPIALRK